MAIDFDTMRVDELFKDDKKKELKEGITVRDINSVVGMTPPARTDLHEVLQSAYKLLYDSAHKSMDKAMKTSLQPPQKSQQSYDFTPPKKTLAEQMAENQQQEKPVEKPATPTFDATLTNPLGTNLIENLEAQIKEKEKLIETLIKERDEAINQQYELEKHHSSKYKELNEKYEDLKSEQESKEKTQVPSVVEDISDDLLEYLKDRLARMEQKNDLLNQEVGKLKGMLGI